MTTQTVHQLLGRPITYDIIIGDFGRDATIEYLRLMAARERCVLEPILSAEGREFFDEYRRLMFVVLADVAFFKRESIASAIEGRGYFTDAILMGVGFTPPPREFVERVAINVAYEVYVALGKGHEHIRIAIPCNGLSGLARDVSAILRSEAAISALATKHSIDIPHIEQITAARPEVHTVPDSVLKYLSRRTSATAPVLLLGTKGTNDIYRESASSLNVRILPINDGEYSTINRAIVAAIGGDKDGIDIHREQLRSEIIEPNRTQFPELVVVEACTDFDLGLGLSSLKIFAEEMVSDAYLGPVSDECERARQT